MAQVGYFYPRSPCGERLIKIRFLFRLPKFLSTLSLRRATSYAKETPPHITHFYPRSPCGERRIRHVSEPRSKHFYPRSPCGERPETVKTSNADTKFLSTLSLRRATGTAIRITKQHFNFYPRSPCGERLIIIGPVSFFNAHFYPRSPCGERRLTDDVSTGGKIISIHALLAESDSNVIDSDCNLTHFYPRSPCGERLNPNITNSKSKKFLSTLSLRRATEILYMLYWEVIISIHALLAESDIVMAVRLMYNLLFLSTLSLRRATQTQSFKIPPLRISIHALLAESDA